MTTDFTTQRILSDIQSGLAKLADNSRRRPARPGQAIIQRAAGMLARVAGDEALAHLMETKAAASPAMTTVTNWATELTATGLPGLILSLERQSALAAILTRSPQVGTLANGATRVPVAGLAPAARVVTEGSAIPVLRGTFTPLTLSAFKLAAICHFSHELAEYSMIENAGACCSRSPSAQAWTLSRSRPRRLAGCSTA
jgi:HK97 family phage major capsid protein